MKLTPPFRFKRFTVQQTRAAMKVGFDGILLGAWTAVGGCRQILDVGTGTGLVALMLAQRSRKGTAIDAIDIDQAAAEEAFENFRASPWSQQLSVKHLSLEDFANDPIEEYDLVVCNPPYFAGADNNSNVARSKARNSRSLDLETLFATSHKVLSKNGQSSVIVPMELAQTCRNAANRFGWVAQRELQVRSLPGRPVHRTLLQFGPGANRAQTVEELTIEREHHVYSDEFRALARDFYLAF